MTVEIAVVATMVTRLQIAPGRSDVATDGAQRADSAARPNMLAVVSITGAIETAPIVLADATALFGGGFGSDLAERLQPHEVLTRLDGRNVEDEYLRSLAVVALRPEARQACAS